MTSGRSETIAKSGTQPITKQSVGLSVAELEILRDRILLELKLGKQATGYKAKALIIEFKQDTTASTHKFQPFLGV
jgi:hypothetical protein